jgi:hypothetical protein
MSAHIISFVPKDVPHLVAIELPCVTENNEKAKSLLGGEERIVISLQNEATVMQMSFNSHFYDRPIEGSRMDCGGVLLRYKRKKAPKVRMNSSADGAAADQDIRLSVSQSILATSSQVDIVGFVSKVYSFQTPFDFQVIVFIVVKFKTSIHSIIVVSQLD